MNDGSLSVAPAFDATTEPAVYRYDPTGPLNDAGGGGPRPTGDQRDDEADSVTWTGPPLTEATEVTGWPSLRFWASSSAPDTDFVVELTEVAPDGTSTVITRGWLNGPQSIDRTDPPDLNPNRIYEFTVALWPLSHVVPAGHRLRVSVSGSDSPGTGLNPRPSTITIFQDRAHPSMLALPVIPAN